MAHVLAIAKDVEVDAGIQLKGIRAENIGARCEIFLVKLLNGWCVGEQAVLAPAHTPANQLGSECAIEQNRFPALQSCARLFVHRDACLVEGRAIIVNRFWIFNPRAA